MKIKILLIITALCLQASMLEAAAPRPKFGRNIIIGSRNNDDGTATWCVLLHKPANYGFWTDFGGKKENNKSYATTIIEALNNYSAGLFNNKTGIVKEQIRLDLFPELEMDGFAMIRVIDFKPAREIYSHANATTRSDYAWVPLKDILDAEDIFTPKDKDDNISAGVINLVKTLKPDILNAIKEYKKIKNPTAPAYPAAATTYPTSYGHVYPGYGYGAPTDPASSGYGTAPYGAPPASAALAASRASATVYGHPGFGYSAPAAGPAYGVPAAPPASAAAGAAENFANNFLAAYIASNPRQTGWISDPAMASGIAMLRANGCARWTDISPANRVTFYNRGEPHYEFTNFYHPERRDENGAFINWIMIDGAQWPTTEHYFQAMKFSNNAELREQIRTAATPRDAFNIARTNQANIRKDWHTVKVNVMLTALRAKFSQYPVLRQLLIDTKYKVIIEAALVDAYWGYSGDDKTTGAIYDQNGANMLGRCLMIIRDEINAGLL